MEREAAGQTGKRGVRVLLLAACGYAAALLAAHYLLPETALPYAALTALALMLPAALWKRRRTACFLLLTAAAVGFCWYRGYTKLFVDPPEAFVGQERTVSVRVCGYPEVFDDYTRVAVRSVDAEVPHVRMLLYDYDAGMDELRPGDLAEVRVRLLSAGLRAGEESDDYYADGILLRGSRKGEYRVTGRAALWWVYAPKTLSRIIQRQALRCFPEDVAPLMKALLTGNRREYSADGELAEAMRAAGFSHVVAVSGAQYLLLGFYTIARKPVNSALFGHRLRRCTPKLRFT